MMKKIVLFLFATFFVTMIGAQSCVPDELFRDSSVGVYPLPFKEDRPNGGINVPACINEPYDFVITVKVPRNVTVSGFEVQIDSVSVATTGAVLNLPEGMSYACNPPTCVLVPEDTLSCIVLFGTPTNSADIGIKDIMVNATVHTNIISQPIVLPDNTGAFPGADGNYFLEVREEGACMVQTNTRDYLNDQISLVNTPNPFGYETVIEVTSLSREELTFEVFGLVGQRVHAEKVTILAGTNRIPFDGSQLENGIYNYSFSNGESRVSNKMVVLK